MIRLIREWTKEAHLEEGQTEKRTEEFYTRDERILWKNKLRSATENYRILFLTTSPHAILYA
ncbi:hypothetical protein WN48_00494 [Eufriesea mexicana]|nr:hypothetical protein WN48_00494 [Eufriesea mexicana]